MFSVRNLLVIAIVGGGAFLFSPEPQSNEAVAQSRYWNNYWRWYDNDYRGYYNRQYNRQYQDYNRGYRQDPYYRDQYNQPYSQYNQPYSRYGQPSGTYYRDGRAWDPRRSVNVGGLNIRWR